MNTLINLDTYHFQTLSLCSHWAVPIIQGFVQIETCTLDFDTSPDKSPSELSPEFGQKNTSDPWSFTMALISRRSIHRAGKSCLS